MSDKHFKPFGGNCWVRPGDEKLYDDTELFYSIWLKNTQAAIDARLAAGQPDDEIRDDYALYGRLAYEVLNL
jgi:hypothetical protein